MRIAHRNLVIFIGLIACSALSQAQEGIHWFDNYKAALDEAKKTGKPLFVEYRCEP